MKRLIPKEQMRAARARVLAKLRAHGAQLFCRDLWMHPDDWPRVARYIDNVNAQRFPDGARPARLIQPERPRGGVTVKEAAERLGIDIDSVRARIRRKVLITLPVRAFHRAIYISEASLRAEERALDGFDTDAAANYLRACGRPVAPKTLINLRDRGRGPAYTITSFRRVRYSRQSLNAWLGIKRRNEK